jgi:class 3 adenylate cyclase
VTFLFTDIEGSTHLGEAAPDIMPAALERHDAIIGSAIGTHGGYIFATGGDGFAAAFSQLERRASFSTTSPQAPLPVASSEARPLRRR